MDVPLGIGSRAHTRMDSQEYSQETHAPNTRQIRANTRKYADGFAGTRRIRAEYAQIRERIRTNTRGYAQLRTNTRKYAADTRIRTDTHNTHEYARIRGEYAQDTHEYANGYARIRTNTHAGMCEYTQIRTWIHTNSCGLDATVSCDECKITSNKIV